jgi:hypothetical protein
VQPSQADWLVGVSLTKVFFASFFFRKKKSFLTSLLSALSRPGHSVAGAGNILAGARGGVAGG